MKSAVALCVCKILLMQTFSVVVQQTSGLFFTAPINYKYPCGNTTDVLMGCEPGLYSDKINKLFFKINRNFTTNSTVKMRFDSDIILRMSSGNDTIVNPEWSTVILRAGDIMEKRFLTPGTGFSFVLMGTTSGQPNLTSLTINDIEFCKEPIMGLFNKCAEETEYLSEDQNEVKAGPQNLTKRDFQCGRRTFIQEDPISGIDLYQDTGSVVGGFANAGDWPWHVAVLALPIISYIDLEQGMFEEHYKCGGTLISRNFVLTAKFCAWLFNKDIEQDSTEFNVFYVALGRTNFIYNFREKNNVKVVRIITPASNTNSSWLDDIALLKLQSEVRFTREIQPACLWHNRENDLANDNRVGVLAGWGKTNYGKFNVHLKQINLPIVSRDICIKNVPIFEPYVTEKDFCAGYLDNGTSPCFGDIGGALQVFIPDNTGNKSAIISGTWYVRGVMTKAMSNTKENVQCDENTYAIFAKEEEFANWIDSNLDF